MQEHKHEHRIMRKADRILPLTVSMVGGLISYLCIKGIIEKESSDFVVLSIFAGLFGCFSIWLAKESTFGNRSAGWLSSSGILFYCMFRHLSPLLSNLYYYAFGQRHIVVYSDWPTYLVLTVFFTVTGYLCLKASQTTHNT